MLLGLSGRYLPNAADSSQGDPALALELGVQQFDYILTSKKTRIFRKWNNKDWLWLFPCYGFSGISNERHGIRRDEHMRIGTREIISLDYFDILGAMSPSVFTHSA